VLPPFRPATPLTELRFARSTGAADVNQPENPRIQAAIATSARQRADWNPLPSASAPAKPQGFMPRLIESGGQFLMRPTAAQHFRHEHCFKWSRRQTQGAHGWNESSFVSVFSVAWLRLGMPVI
jgi:hypothetical protein